MSKIARLALSLVLPGFKLDPKSNIHGVAHWARVASNGKKLAKVHGINENIVEWFAYLHDSQRLNDDYDPGHGARAAAVAWSLRDAGHIDLPVDSFFHLQYALATHSDGHLRAPLEVGVCWDADRLDLPRVRVTPDPYRMATPAGAEMAWRFHR